MNRDAQRRVAMITGAAGGLGKSIAARLAAGAYRVVLTDRDRSALSQLKEAVGGDCETFALDVSDENDWAGVIGQIESSVGPLSVLVNNAGVFRPNVPFEEVSLEHWRLHMQVNSDGTFLGCREAIRCMKARGDGAIVNIASGMGLRPNPTAAAYCASKAAVLMTTRCAAAAAGPYGIRVNAVLPGAVDTAMLRGNVEDASDADAYVAGLARYSSLGCLATAEDIADAVHFLASPAASAITGVALPVDGGNLT